MATGPNYPYDKKTNPTGYKPGSIEEKRAKSSTGTETTAPITAPSTNFVYNQGNPGMNSTANVGLNNATVPVDEYGQEVGGTLYVVRSDGQKVLTTISELYNKAIQDITKEERSMPYMVEKYRQEIYRELSLLAKQKLNNKEYAAIYSAL